MAYKFRVGDLVYHNTLSPGAKGTYTHGEILELKGTDMHPAYRLKWPAHGTAVDPEHVLEFMPGTEPTAEPAESFTPGGFVPGQLVRVAPGHNFIFYGRNNEPELAFYNGTEPGGERWLRLTYCNGQELRTNPRLVTPELFASAGPGDRLTIEELQDQIQDLQRALALAHEALKAAAIRS